MVALLNSPSLLACLTLCCAHKQVPGAQPCPRFATTLSCFFFFPSCNTGPVARLPGRLCAAGKRAAGFDGSRFVECKANKKGQLFGSVAGWRTPRLCITSRSAAVPDHSTCISGACLPRYSCLLTTIHLIAANVQVVRQPVVVAGNSIGGFISASMAGDYPGLVEGLVLLNSAGEALSSSSTLDALLVLARSAFVAAGGWQPTASNWLGAEPTKLLSALWRFVCKAA